MQLISSFAFMVLAREYHPDKWDINTSKLSFDESVEKFKHLSNAYNELIQSNILI